ncbi:MAG: DNA mismatch repair protein MutS [Lachnospiraceae bacterium]|nr:DNA mismatch repair protein MutS [Lachnospiraceae bacterium]
MMQNYLKTKEEYNDCFLFYRLGDFYELFFEDAERVSKLLDLTLTGKNCGLPERAPMCGVPFHAADGYIDKLVNDGYKVAICEQVEDPKTAKGLVKREVIRVATPGTNLNIAGLDDTRNNYLMSVIYTTNKIGISYADVTTGAFYLTEFDDLSNLLDEIYKINPKEIICNESFMVSGIDLDRLRNDYGIIISDTDPLFYDDERCKNALLKHFNTESIEGLGISDFTIGVVAAGFCLLYMEDAIKTELSHITSIKPYVSSDYMLLDISTRRNLELCETMREKEKRGSLFWVLDKTRTAMGARALRNAIEQPLIKKKDIELRLDAVESIYNNQFARNEFRADLNSVYDLERLISKISYKSANPRDLIALKQSLLALPDIKYQLADMKDTLLSNIYNELDIMKDLYDLIDAAIVEEPPITVREGGIIKPGYNEDADRLRVAQKEGKNWLNEELETEREKTGIKNLKLKYNKVFGYYLEVTNSFKDKVPEDWIRKQTLVNAERYMTPKLKELEETILGAQDKLYDLEYDLFSEVLNTLFNNIERIQKTATHIANLDMFVSLAHVAVENRYVRPQITTDGKINIKKGRHPVVEKMIKNDLFIDNDTKLDNEDRRISIITGPNMAGKSTYMRQSALIVLMAQLGSFVPAESAVIGVTDRIFTRVGASDDLASGQSTFMVEMTEVANILRNATKNSLIILDEIGRGTSTYDGLAIAWAVVEYISNKAKIGAKTLFATHYHELTELEGKLSGVNNYCIAVKEQKSGIIFLRKIIKGGADKSYGIEVARLAGVPEDVLIRAREIVDELVDNTLLEKVKQIEIKQADKKDYAEYEENRQLSFFDYMDNSNSKNDEIIDKIKALNVSSMTPIEALNFLDSLQKDVKNL